MPLIFLPRRASHLNGDFDGSVSLRKREEPATDPGSMDHDQVVLQVWSDILELPVESIGRKRNLFRLVEVPSGPCGFRHGLRICSVPKWAAISAPFSRPWISRCNTSVPLTSALSRRRTKLRRCSRRSWHPSLGLKAEAVSVSLELLPLVGDMAKAFALFDAICKVFADVEIGEDFLRLTTIRQMADYLWPKVFGDTHADREMTYFPLMDFQETLYCHRKGFVQNEPSGLSCSIHVNAPRDGDFRADLFDQALNLVIRRHPIMRAVIDEEREKPRFKMFKTVPEIPAEASAPELRLFCLPYACGNPTMFRHFASLLPSFCTVLAANLPGHGKTGEALSSIPEMAALCVEQLAAFDDGTPLVLLGYSFGGFLAYEIARRLEVKGRPASGVVLVASPPPGVTGGLRAILDSPEEEIIRITKEEVYHYDFSEMTTAERQDYLRTLKIDTRAMLDFVFGKPVSAPMLNLVGEAEEETELRTLAKDWNTVFANAAYRQIGGAHMLIKTHVDELAATTSDFIHGLLHQNVPA